MKIPVIVAISLVGFIATPTLLQAGNINSFNQAKNALYSKVYPKKGKTIYTGCSWHMEGKKKVISLKSCGLDSQITGKRAYQLEAEHVIPSSFGYKKNNTWRSCVGEAKSKGKNIRSYCRKNDEEFKRFHNDLVGLFPSVGTINMKRSNKPFAESESGSNSQTFYGKGRQITITSRVAIPPAVIRGDVARVGLFYEQEYGIKLNARQKALYQKWNKEDPVSQEEVDRNNRIIKTQGWGNSLISRH